ncbi:hypothetical protein ACDH55_25855 [Pseudomonas tremae]|nr:hypothetical protein [Pseudomonas coronafaciens]
MFTVNTIRRFINRFIRPVATTVPVIVFVLYLPDYWIKAQVYIHLVARLF